MCTVKARRRGQPDARVHLSVSNESSGQTTRLEDDAVVDLDVEYLQDDAHHDIPVIVERQGKQVDVSVGRRVPSAANSMPPLSTNRSWWGEIARR